MGSVVAVDTPTITWTSAKSTEEQERGPTLSFLYIATCPPRRTNHRFFHAFLLSPFFIKYPLLMAMLSLILVFSLLSRSFSKFRLTAGSDLFIPPGLPPPAIDEASESDPDAFPSDASEMAERPTVERRGEEGSTSSRLGGSPGDPGTTAG